MSRTLIIHLPARYDDNQCIKTQRGHGEARRQGQGLDMRHVSSPRFVFFFIYCTSNKYITYKSCGLGQAKPGPSCDWRLWLGLRFEKAKAGSGQAKAGAFRPSRARQITTSNYCHIIHCQHTLWCLSYSFSGFLFILCPHFAY